MDDRALIVHSDRMIYLIEELDSDYVVEVFNDSSSNKPICICTYSHMAIKMEDNRFNNEWGLIIYDNAYHLPATSYSKTAYITSKYKLAMDSMLWRSDNKENLIFKAIGPKVFNLTLKKLEVEGYQMKINCYEVKVPFVPWDIKKEKIENHTYSKNENKIETCNIINKLHENKQKIIVSHFKKVAKRLGKSLNITYCDGDSDLDFRINTINQFNCKDIDSIILTGIFENQSLEDIDVLIALSYNGKSTREEYKRIGKLKGSNNNAAKLGL